MLRLVISDDRGAKTIVPLVRDEITIGRAENNTIRLTERNVSRSHAQIHVENGICVVKDLDSYCGVTVNGTLISAETEVKLGDRIGIGDYIIAIEVEPENAQVTTQPGVRVRGGAEEASEPANLARLVMLTPPSPGEELALRDDGSVLLGRAEDLEHPIDHRSVSREHAEIRGEHGLYRISDLRSINGTAINGEKVTDKELQAGDLIAIGEVVFRFVAVGENYVYDPREAAVALRSLQRPWRVGFMTLTAVTAVVATLMMVLYWYREQSSASVTPITPIAQHVQPSPKRRQQIDRWVQDCRAAIAGERYAEAIAYAAKALEAAPQEKEAKHCKEVAERRNEQEQIYVRGKAELVNNNLERAYSEFRHLEENSPYWEKPEVRRTVVELARSRVDLARSVLANDRSRAVALAMGVLRMKGVPGEIRQAAEDIRDKPIAEPEPAAVAKGRGSHKRAEAKVSSRTSVYQQSATSYPYTRVSGASKTTSGGSEKPFQVARTCLARGDNQCIIRALEGKAQSAEELGLLIETYRSVGNNRDARKNMERYVNRFPMGSRANIYRTILKQNK